MPLMLTALWTYRHFIFSSIKRDFESRYRASLLGTFWIVAQPLTMIVIYTVVFGGLMQAGLPGHEQIPFAFSIYLCAGIVFWGLHAEVLSKMTTVFVDQANLIKKTAFPRVCLPAIVAGTALVNLVVILLLFFLFLLWINHWPGQVVLALVPILCLQMMLSMGLGLLLGTLHVFFRDVGQFVSILLQFWFWLTPIVYPLQIVPERFTAWLALNPMQPVMAAYQTIFLARTAPDFSSLTSTLWLAIVLLLFGVWLFLRHAHELVDEL